MKKYMLILTLAITALLFACSTSKQSQYSASAEMEYCTKKVQNTLTSLYSMGCDYTMMPRNICEDDSVWHCRKATPEEWCAGFWPGILWYAYEATGDIHLKEQAQRYTASLDYLAWQPIYDHDLGFVMYCSMGNGLRLTEDPTYKAALLASADSLATLFNPAVGTILSWPRNVAILGGHNTIMDNMMNLELLFWAAKNGGDQRLFDIAVTHAETTMANHFREDYSCYHVAVYDSISGKFIKGMTHQGYSDDSMWARGQSWAIYGYTMVYRETGDTKFLDFACKVTDTYLKRLPEDEIPYWDFDVPAIPSAPRDASAACIVASALLELQSYCPGEKGKSYLRHAKCMLESLSSENYRSKNTKMSFLDHSVGHHPANSEIDAAIIYADYYYIEALTRLIRLEKGQAVV